jgi:hypothetical protein
MIKIYRHKLQGLCVLVQELSVQTAILSEPARLPQEALSAIANRSPKQEEGQQR